MDIDQEITKLFHELGRLSQKESQKKELAHLTVLNLQLLGYIFFSETPPKMRDIAENVGITLPSLSVMVDRLEKDGLISRSHDKNDKRVVQAQLTAKGRALIQREITNSTQTIKTALEDFTEEEKNVVFRFFKAHTKAMGDEMQAN